MKTTFTFLLGLTFALTLGSVLTPTNADETIVNAPGVQIFHGANGTSVVTPGAQIETSQPSSPVIAPTANTAIVDGMASPATSASYISAQLAGMDFSNQNLSGADFTNATLTGANFRGAILTGAKFNNATLSNVDFSNANLTSAHMINATLSGANLTNADLSRVDLTNATLDHALAINTRFNGAILNNVDMSVLVRQATQRAAFVDADAISSALKIDPAHPTMPHKIDLTINFDFNSDKLTTDGAKQVHEIANALKDADLQKSRILVEGHTDSIGSDSYNQALSYRRAMCVLRTLIEEYKIPATQLSAKGFGKTEPIASNENDLGRAMNRRVTLVNVGS